MAFPASKRSKTVGGVSICLVLLIVLLSRHLWLRKEDSQQPLAPEFTPTELTILPKSSAQGLQPKSGHPDSSDKSTASTSGVLLFPDTPVGHALQTHFGKIHLHEVGANEKYHDSLRELKQLGPEVIRVLTETYFKADERQYSLRSDLLETLRALHDESTLGAFARILSTPVPPEQFSDQHHSSSQMQEVKMRMTAIRGVLEFAQVGNSQAEKTVLDMIHHPDISIRKLAIQGYLRINDGQKPRRIEYLKSVLSEEDQKLLESEM